MTTTLRHTLLALALALSGAGAAAQVALNGKPLTPDLSRNRYLCPAPQNRFGQSFSAVVTLDPDSAWTEVAINGTTVGNKQTCTFARLDGTTAHRITARRPDGSRVDAQLMFTSLPLLHIIAPPFSTEYQPATLILSYPDQTPADTLNIRVKWRGSTTLMPGRHKRNFHIKLTDSSGNKRDSRLLGMRNDNSWLLDAGQIDPSRIRNLAANRLWLHYAAPPYYAHLEPRARTAINGRLTEVVINNRYEGIYTLFEALDRKQLKLNKHDQNTGTFHGMLWKAQKRDLITRFAETPELPDINKASWGGFDVKYPDTDEVMPTHWQTLYYVVDKVSYAYDSELKRIAADLFDLPVMRDYYLLVYLLNAIDNHAKNLYWACHDVDSLQRLTLGIWDLDCTVGQDWTNTPYRPENRVGPTVNLNFGNGAFTRINAHAPGFAQDVNNRYNLLRKTAFHEDSLVGIYHTLIDTLIASGATLRETERWSGDTDLGGQPLDFENEKRYIADWFHARLAFLDTEIFPNSAVDLIQAPQPEPSAYYDLTGRLVTTRPLPPGVYITDTRRKIHIAAP